MKRDSEQVETSSVDAENLNAETEDSPAKGAEESTPKRELFDYRMKKKSKERVGFGDRSDRTRAAGPKWAAVKTLGSAAQPKERRIVTFDHKEGSKSEVLAKPLVRRLPPTGSRRADPRQRELRLQPPPANREPAAQQDAASDPTGDVVSKEVLFSRFLSGIIDLSFPVVLGFSFVLAASRLIDFDFFMANALEWAAVFSLALYFVGSSFFLLALGQTPGMILTELRLSSEEEGQSVSALQIFTRVALFLPIAATLVGLLWSLFDPQCRTLHDRVTGTRVNPAG